MNNNRDDASTALAHLRDAREALALLALAAIPDHRNIARGVDFVANAMGHHLATLEAALAAGGRA